MRADSDPDPQRDRDLEREPTPAPPRWARALQRGVQTLCLVGGALGALASLWALIDPSILAAQPPGAVPAPSPRWRAAFGLVFSCLVLGYGAGLLRHRKLP